MRPSRAIVLVALSGLALGGGVGLIPLPGAFLWLLAGCLLVAAGLADRDPWLGLLAGYAVLRAGLSRQPGAFEAGVMLLFGAVALCAVRESRTAWWRTAVTTLALVQVAFVAIQWAGVDPFAALRVAGATVTDGVAIHGLTGNSGYVGAFLAMSAGLAAGWALPLVGLGIVASKSVLAALAFAVVLVARYPRSWRWAALSSSLAMAGVWWFRGIDLTSWVYRWETWRVGLGLWWGSAWSAMVGLAPGWLWRRDVVIASGWAPERFAHAHNDVIDFSVGFGLVGVVLLAGWLWAHRQAFRDPGFLGLLVVSLGTFPFQVPAVAPLCLVILGLATARRPPAHPRDREAPG